MKRRRFNLILLFALALASFAAAWRKTSWPLGSADPSKYFFSITDLDLWLSLQLFLGLGFMAFCYYTSYLSSTIWNRVFYLANAFYLSLSFFWYFAGGQIVSWQCFIWAKIFQDVVLGLVFLSLFITHRYQPFDILEPFERFKRRGRTIRST